MPANGRWDLIRRLKVNNDFKYLMLSYIVSNDGSENIKLRVKDVEGNFYDIL